MVCLFISISQFSGKSAQTVDNQPFHAHGYLNYVQNVLITEPILLNTRKS